MNAAAVSGVLSDVDPDEPDRVAAFAVDLLEVGDLGAAWATPRRPEVDHRRTVDVGERLGVAAGEGDDLDVGEALAFLR